MGEVYKAWDPALERWVALKLLPAGRRDQEAIERFLREARAASAVQHDHVAQVFFAGTWGERPYYAMEWVDGPSLAEVRKEQGRLSGPRTLEWMIEAAEGLDAANKAGVIHRDVKPSNLVVDSSGQLKVVDFGLARRLGVDATLTRHDSVVGTPHYMSPEQATGRTLDHRTDIYSLGATFYELLTGRPPFEGDTPVEVATQHVLVDPVPIEERNPHVPAWLARAIGRMLAKEPADRYPDYATLLKDLRSLQSSVVPRIPGSSPAESLRLPRGLGWAIVLAAGLVLGLWLGRGGGMDNEGASVETLSPGPSSPGGEVPQAPAENEGSRPSYEDLVFGGSETSVAAGVEGSAGVGTPESSDPGEQPPVRPVEPRPEVEEATAGKDPEAATVRELQALAKDVLAFRQRSGELPMRLDAASERVAIDGWGRPIRYHRVRNQGFVLASPGADGRPQTGDDLLWERGRVVRGVPRRP